MDPPVSVPVAAGTSLAATAAAEPPDEPPGTRRLSQGLRAGPKCELSVDEPMANSSMLHLPTSTVPARSSCATTCASYGLVYFSSMREPQVVRMVRVHRMSLCAIGMPVSGPAAPRAHKASACFARSSACDGSTLMKAFSASPYRSMRCRQARVSSTDEIFLAASAAPSSPSVALSKLLDD